MQTSTPVRSGNKPAHQHKEPWENFFSSSPVEHWQKKKERDILEDFVANQHNLQHWAELGGGNTGWTLIARLVDVQWREEHLQCAEISCWAVAWYLI